MELLLLLWKLESIKEKYVYSNKNILNKKTNYDKNHEIDLNKLSQWVTIYFFCIEGWLKANWTNFSQYNNPMPERPKVKIISSLVK